MTLINVILVLIAAGVLLWLVRTYIPMAPPFPQIITAVVVIFIVLWLLSIFGILGSIQSVRIGR